MVGRSPRQDTNVRQKDPPTSLSYKAHPGGQVTVGAAPVDLTYDEILPVAADVFWFH